MNPCNPEPLFCLVQKFNCFRLGSHVDLPDLHQHPALVDDFAARLTALVVGHASSQSLCEQQLAILVAILAQAIVVRVLSYNRQIIGE